MKRQEWAEEDGKETRWTARGSIVLYESTLFGIIPFLQHNRSFGETPSSRDFLSRDQVRARRSLALPRNDPIICEDWYYSLAQNSFAQVFFPSARGALMEGWIMEKAGDVRGIIVKGMGKEG
jgi:hypothetical protein